MPARPSFEGQDRRARAITSRVARAGASTHPRRTQEINLDRLLGLKREIEKLRGRGKEHEGRIKALRQKQSLYRELFSRSHDGIAVIQGSRLKEVNPALARMLKSPAAELRNRRFTDFLSSETLLNVKALYGRRLRGESVNSVFETVIVGRSGRSIPVEVNAGTTFYGGDPADLVIIRDLTYLKIAEAEILRLRQYEESFLDNVNIWLQVDDARGDVVVWNKAAEEISGYPAEEIIGRRKCLAVLYPDAGRRREVARMFGSGGPRGPEPAGFETEIVCKDGSKRSLSWHSRSILDREANVIGRITLGVDLTARVQAETDLAKGRKTIEALLDAIPESVYLVDPRGRILASNETARRRWKKEDQELRGQAVDDILPPASAGLSEKIRRVLRTGTPLRGEDADDGRIFDTAIFPIFGNDGRTEQIAVFSMDVTERKTAEDALQRQKALLEEKNVALREMIRQVGDEKRRLGERVKANVDRSLLPLVGKLKAKGGRIDDIHIDLLQSGLNELTNSFGLAVGPGHLQLTHREVEVAQLIKNGLTSKEIAHALVISVRTVGIHRGRIRKKLGLGPRRQNLREALWALSSSRSSDT